MPIDRCVCYAVPFREMWDYARAHHCGFEGLQRQFHCGGACALCVPYVKAMLRTGQVSFPDHVPPPAESAPEARSQPPA